MIHFLLRCIYPEVYSHIFFCSMPQQLFFIAIFAILFYHFAFYLSIPPLNSLITQTW